MPQPSPVRPPVLVVAQDLPFVNYYRLLDSVHFTRKSDGWRVQRSGGGPDIEFKRADEIRLLQALTTGWVPEAFLISDGGMKRKTNDGKPGAWPPPIDRLREAGYLQLQVRRGSETWCLFKPAPAASASLELARPRLSRFAYLHREGERWILESPLTPVRVEPQSPNLLDLLHSSGKTDDPDAQPIWRLLGDAGLTVSSDDAEGLDGMGPLAYWAFHDLLFHGASLTGRKGVPATGTYRWRGRLDPPPALVPDLSNGFPRIDLSEPTNALLQALQQPLSTLLAQRRSRREPGSTNVLQIGQIGACLYDAARVIWVQAIPDDADQVTYRPYPSGGARHPLELYLLVRRCHGLAPGLYHYDPIWHSLQRIPLVGPRRAEMEGWDPFSNGEEPLPPVTVLITARIGRTAWKYEDIAYRLIQNDLGCLYQTLYLTASALRMGPCAIGNVDTGLFAEATGIDDLVEPWIGALTLYP